MSKKKFVITLITIILACVLILLGCSLHNKNYLILFGLVILEIYCILNALNAIKEKDTKNIILYIFNSMIIIIGILLIMTKQNINLMINIFICLIFSPKIIDGLEAKKKGEMFKFFMYTIVSSILIVLGLSYLISKWI